MSEDIFIMREDRITSYVTFTFANSCMPTLLKVKPSSLVSFHKRYIPDEEEFYHTLTKELKKFDCKYEILYVSNTVHYVLIYYKPSLEKMIEQYNGHEILCTNGYGTNPMTFDENLRNFKIRFYKYQMKEIAFPDELGIFLGYPIKDVEEYIKNSGQNYLICGYWKVYHDVEEANRMFQLYRNLREQAIDMFYSGKELCEIKTFI